LQPSSRAGRKSKPKSLARLELQCRGAGRLTSGWNGPLKSAAAQPGRWAADRDKMPPNTALPTTAENRGGSSGK